jgi:hypothetical protein
VFQIGSLLPKIVCAVSTNKFNSIGNKDWLMWNVTFGRNFATPIEFMNYDQDGIITYKVIGVMAGAIQALSAKITNLQKQINDLEVV